MDGLRRRGGWLASAALIVAGVMALRADGAAVLTASSVAVNVDIVSRCSQPLVLSGGDCFRPSPATVSAAGTVTWTNMTFNSHTLVRCTDACSTGPGTGADSPFGASSQMRSFGASYSFTFNGPGTYYYDCSGGGCAVGEIIVNAPSPSPTPVVLSPGPGTAPSATPSPSPTPLPAPSPTPPPPSDTSPAAVATPTSDASPSAFAPDAAGAPSAGGGGGSSLAIIVLIVLTLLALGGGVLSFRMFRG